MGISEKVALAIEGGDRVAEFRTSAIESLVSQRLEQV